jgi:hypothetical protein
MDSIRAGLAVVCTDFIAEARVRVGDASLIWAEIRKSDPMDGDADVGGVSCWSGPTESLEGVLVPPLERVSYTIMSIYATGSCIRTWMICSTNSGVLCFSLGVGRPKVWNDAVLERDFVGVASNSSLISRFLFLERVGEGKGGPSHRNALAKYGYRISE